MKHLKIKIMSIALLAAATSSMAQSLDKMNWLNEPQQWEIKEGKALVMAFLLIGTHRPKRRR